VKLMKLICWYLLISLSVSAWPQSPPSSPTDVLEKGVLQGSQAAKIKGEVQKRGTSERSRVRITLKDKTEVRGYISRIDADSFQVTGRKSEQVTTIAYQDAMRIRRDGLSTAAKVAITAGVVARIWIAVGLITFAAYGD
jgi:hypothetical protein